jgi:hypothetical protein
MTLSLHVRYVPLSKLLSVWWIKITYIEVRGNCGGSTVIRNLLLHYPTFVLQSRGVYLNWQASVQPPLCLNGVFRIVRAALHAYFFARSWRRQCEKNMIPWRFYSSSHFSSSIVAPILWVFVQLARRWCGDGRLQGYDNRQSATNIPTYPRICCLLL